MFSVQTPASELPLFVVSALFISVSCQRKLRQSAPIGIQKCLPHVIGEAHEFCLEMGALCRPSLFKVVLHNQKTPKPLHISEDEMISLVTKFFAYSFPEELYHCCGKFTVSLRSFNCCVTASLIFGFLKNRSQRVNVFYKRATWLINKIQKKRK